ncbi:collagen-like protein [Patescibacteria group bacterium]
MKTREGLWIFAILFFFLLCGCSTAMTKKGRIERDFALIEKELFTENLETIALYNCVQSGVLTPEACANKYSFHADAVSNQDGLVIKSRTVTTISESDSASMVFGSSGGSPRLDWNYCNIGFDPVNLQRKLGSDESVSVLLEDLRVKMKTGSKREVFCTLRGGDPGHAVVLGSSGPRWVKACGNPIVEIYVNPALANIVPKEKTTTKTVEVFGERKPNFKSFYRPNMGEAYKDAAPGTWAGEAWGLTKIFDGVAAAAIGGYFYEKGQAARRPDQNSTTTNFTGGNAVAEGGKSGAVSNSKSNSLTNSSASASSASTDGEDGDDGQDGRDGSDGTDGEDGDDGQDGRDGRDGTDGTDGQDGTDGGDGEDGPSGATGDQGPAGATGDQGPTGAAGNDGNPTGATGEGGPSGGSP